MNEYPFRKSQSRNPLPYILLAGLLIGIAISWSLFKTPAASAQLTPTQTTTNRLSMLTATTAVVPQFVAITPQVNTQSNAVVGKPAPDFSLQTIAGKEIRLSNLKGRPVLINLWASWCPPCRYEMPGIQAAYEKYKDQGLVVLGVDFTVQDNLTDVKAFVQELNLTFPILLDETGDVSSGLYGMRGLPTSYFIDPEGVLQRIQVGAMLPEKLEEYLGEILVK
jgi:cytochrome c biogenesis protein CcmG, thiol:disulfide interchange protein DsbE